MQMVKKKKTKNTLIVCQKKVGIQNTKETESESVFACLYKNPDLNTIEILKNDLNFFFTEI